MTHSAPTVLVVEDHAELREALKEALTSDGYEVLDARSATEALEILRAKDVDLLISDLTAQPDAPRVIDDVRTEFPELPIVALSEPTRFRRPADEVWQRHSGIRTLSKPFRLGELLAVSREVLQPDDRSPDR